MAGQIERFPLVAQHLKSLAEALRHNSADLDPGSPDKLLFAAKCIEESYKYITSMPVVIDKARTAAIMDGYRDVAQILYEAAEKLETTQTPMRAHVTIRNIADALLQSVADEKRVRSIGNPPEKSKLVIN